MRGTWPQEAGGRGKLRIHGGRFGVREECGGRRSWDLLGEEGFRSGDKVDQGAKGVLVRLEVGDRRVEVDFIRVAHFAAEGVGGKFGGETAEEEIFVFEELILKSGDAGEFGAIGHFGGGVDDGIVFTNATLVSESFLEPPFPGGVEVFKRETEWVDLVVAAGALRELTVDGEALTDGRFVDSGDFGRDLTDVGDRETWIGAEEVFENPGAASDGRGTGSIRGHTEDGCLRDDATASMSGRNRNFTDGVTANVGDVIEAGEALVDRDEVRA